jgi:hypothetical protein
LVRLGVQEAVTDGVGEGVAEDVGLGVRLEVADGDGVEVKDGEGVAEVVRVGLGASVTVAVGVMVPGVGDGPAVAVKVAAGLGVAVGVGVGRGTYYTASSVHSGPLITPPYLRTPWLGPPTAPDESPIVFPNPSSRWYRATVFASGANPLSGCHYACCPSRWHG